MMICHVGLRPKQKPVHPVMVFELNVVCSGSVDATVEKFGWNHVTTFSSHGRGRFLFVMKHRKGKRTQCLKKFHSD